MNFEISEEHQMLRAAVREATARVEPTTAALWPVFCELGLTSICVSEAAGGVEMDALALAVVAEEVAYVSPGMAATLVLHNGTVCGLLERHKDDPKVAGLFADLVVGDRIGVGAVGPKPARQALWVHGFKNVAIGSDAGSVATVYEVTASDRIETAGFEGLGWATLNPENAVVTLSSTDEVMTPLTAMGLGAVAVGIGRAAFDAAASYSVERKQFGKPISQFQAIQWMLADSNAELDAARLLVRSAATSIADSVEGSLPQQCAYRAAETALEIADRAIQIHGGYGYTREYPVERMWRDARQLLVGCLQSGGHLRRAVAERTIGQVR